MTMVQEIKGIAKFVLWGAVGFGVGAIGFGAIRIAGWDLFLLSGGSVPSLLGFPTTGAFGGAALGLALGGWRKAAVLAVVGAITFFVGFLGGFLVMIVFHQSGLRGEGILSIIYGGVPGAIGGAALGLVLLDPRKMIGLAIAGALGFGLGMLIVSLILDPFSGWASTPPIKPWLGWILWGIIGGAFLGASLGYLEKRNTDRGGG